MAGGRPPYFETPEELWSKCEEYFNKCDGRIFFRDSVDEEGNPTQKEINVPEPYTIIGLCQHLGIPRQTLFNYEKKTEFFDIVKVAKERVAYDLTLRSIERKEQVAGCIFQLKANHGHKETSVNEVTGKDGAALVPTTINFLSADEIKAKIDREKADE